MSKHSEIEIALVKTLSSTEVPDLIKEYAEIGIDAVISDGLLKDIPLVGTIVGIAKAGINISDRIFIKKLLKFLCQLNKLSPQMRQNMVNKLESDEAYGRKVGEHVIEILDRIDSYRKPKMIALVFKAYTEGRIDAKKLHSLNHAVDRIPSNEISEVRKIHEMSVEERLNANVDILQCLQNAGLVNVFSGFGSLVYEPNYLCNLFLDLNLDRTDA